MSPSIGRIVHFNSHGRRIPAIVTYVHNATSINLKRFDGTARTESIETSVEYADETAHPAHPDPINNMGTPHFTWSWPPRAV